MDFGGFLGNEGLKSRLAANITAGKMSHSYLLCGPKGSGKTTLARFIAAAMQCTAPQERPCRTCSQCRKVLSGSHPDVVVVDDPEKKTVSVNLARWAKTDLYIRPNEGRKKIYLFPRAHEMGTATQNALLKVMEEPPEYGVFLLLTERGGSLLPTVRSRCVEMTLSPVPEEEALPYLRQTFPKAQETSLRAAWQRSGGFLGQAKDLLKSGEQLDSRAISLAEAFANRDRMNLVHILCKMDKIKRELLLPILHQTQALVAEALSSKAKLPATTPSARLLAEKRTAAELLSAYQVLREAMDSVNANVGTGHICGFLAARLR